MEGSIEAVIRDKILLAMENPPAELTRRDQMVPEILQIIQDFLHYLNKEIYKQKLLQLTNQQQILYIQLVLII